MPSLENFLTRPPSNRRRNVANFIKDADNPNTRLGFWVFLSFLPSIVLLILSCRNICLDTAANSWIKSKRPTVTVITTTVSMLLAWLQKSVAKGVARRVVGHRLKKVQVSHGSFSPDKSSAWRAIINGRFSGLSSSWRMVISSAIFFAFLQALAPVWTGALTPEASEKEMARSIEIPHYAPDDTHEYWNQEIGNQELPTEKTDFGSFSYSPIYTILGSILHSVSAVTATDNATQTYLKLDSTGYRYLNRSYGVGASAGFYENTQKKDQDLKRISYIEPGHLSTVRCSRDSAMKGEVKSEGNGWYRVTQQLPHGSVENIRLPGFNGDSNIVALLGNPSNKRAGWGIVTGKNATVYRRLNMVFCEVFFESHNFDVLIEPGDGVIQVTVSKNQSLDDSSLPNPESYFTDNVVRQIGMVVQTSATAYSSPLGAALISNIERTQHAQKNGFVPRDVDTTLRGIETAIEAMIDHILIGFASAQYCTGNSGFGRIKVPTMTSYTAFKFGELPFLIGNIVFNIIILVGFVVEKLFYSEMSDITADEIEDMLRSSNYGESSQELLGRHPQHSNGNTARQDEPAEP